VSFICTACVTHLVELAGAMPRFCMQGAKVWAVRADSLSGYRIPPRAAIGSTEAIWRTDARSGKTRSAAIHLRVNFGMLG
jgi:hypothetical protein